MGVFDKSLASNSSIICQCFNGHRGLLYAGLGFAQHWDTKYDNLWGRWPPKRILESYLYQGACGSGQCQGHPFLWTDVLQYPVEPAHGPWETAAAAWSCGKKFTQNFITPELPSANAIVFTKIRIRSWNLHLEMFHHFLQDPLQCSIAGDVLAQDLAMNYQYVDAPSLGNITQGQWVNNDLMHWGNTQRLFYSQWWWLLRVSLNWERAITHHDG